MQQTADKELSDYLSTIEKYYPLELIPDGISLKLTHEEFLALFPAQLKRAWKEAEAAAGEWTKLVERIKEKSWIQFIRNHELMTRQAYKLIIGIKQENLEPGCSIVVFLSFIGKKIGLLYVDLNAPLSNQRPVYDYSRNPNRARPITYASYFPFTKSHELYISELLTEITSLFPEFTLFDNQLADYKVNTIQTEEDSYLNIDLFMVFFERGLPAGV
ncbi:hypothetical protein EXU85_15420 [Spirosoma sp. KCTC 42546]|uniref:hypothetical protein n=1 Tax=Spirosoma sp. KCTC 42546 TaxID=2520506 RepID=UPI00115BB945|nr:hypothetical protein [Spirosoma sp. KCTC 42546]QDK79924.1 hypothetical protein EXU85_15420 [Spirosoma sp. KCTC 42546]